MGCKRRTCFSPACHRVEDAAWWAGFARQLCEPDDAETRLRSRFGHDRVAAGERGRDPPRRKAERVVPGNDLGRHTKRLSEREVTEALFQGNARAEDLVGDTGKVFEVARGGGDVVFRLA